MEKTSDRKKLYLGLAAVIVVLAVLLIVYNVAKPKTSAGAKAYTVEVVNDAGEMKTYTGRTDAEYLRGLMDELAEAGDFSYEGEESTYGLMINTINGLTADYNADQAYWAIYVNGDYGQYGADQQPVTDGDTYRFEYTK